MARIWQIGLIAVIAAVAVGGIGFAAFTSTATINGTATGGTLNLQWTPTGTPSIGAGTLVETNAFDGCSATVAPSLITITATNLAPGDECYINTSYGLFLENTGSLPATVPWTFASDYIWSGGTAACPTSNFNGGDTLYAGTYIVPAGGYVGQGSVVSGTPIVVIIGLDSGTGNACQGVSATLTIYEPGVAGV